LRKGALFQDKSNLKERNYFEKISSSLSKKEGQISKRKSPRKNFDINRAFSGSRKSQCCSEQKQQTLSSRLSNPRQ
jgi:hypothetical protein